MTTIHVKQSGAYYPATAYVKQSGVYVAATVYVKQTGAYGGVGAPSALSQLTTLISGLGGTLWVPGQQCFVDSAGTTPAVLGDPVGRINDLCGSNYAWQDTTANKPILGVDADGKSILTFDGSNDFLRTGITTPVAGYIAGSWRSDSTGTARSIFSSSNSAAIAGAKFNKGATEVFSSARLDGAAATFATTVATVGSVKNILDGHYSAANAAIRINGVNEATSATARTATSTNYFRIGADGAGGDAQSTYWLGTMLAHAWIPSTRPGATVEAQIRTLLAEITAVSGVV